MSDPGLEPSSIPTETGVTIAEAEDSNRPKRVMGFRDLLLFYVVTGISLRWTPRLPRPALIGIRLYWAGKRRAQRNPAFSR